MGSYGAQFCEIRVNEYTGEARVARWVGAFDTGRILNAKTARSQFQGGIIMGIGMALTEETLFDERTGRYDESESGGVSRAGACGCSSILRLMFWISRTRIRR